MSEKVTITADAAVALLGYNVLPRNEYSRQVAAALAELEAALPQPIVWHDTPMGQMARIGDRIAVETAPGMAWAFSSFRLEMDGTGIAEEPGCLEDKEHAEKWLRGAQ